MQSWSGRWRGHGRGLSATPVKHPGSLVEARLKQYKRQCRVCEVLLSLKPSTGLLWDLDWHNNPAQQCKLKPDRSALKLLSYALKIQLDNSCSHIKHLIMEMHFTLVLLLVLCAVLPTDGQTERAFRRKHIKPYMTPLKCNSEMARLNRHMS
ncbi:hypothetical protein SRHO_G00286210 [Serrasalmus rhombeus]